MDGNKDAALKCARIGKEALENGDRARALKFLSKARRLDPSLPIGDLISSIDKVSDDHTPSNSASASFDEASSKKPNGSSSVRARVSSEKSSSSSNAYTEEQIAIVRQVKRQKDYYEILGLEKSCSIEDVRKAYRKLSLKVHPDKNKAPGAEEAFKVVSKAFQCLSNEESRKQYDVVGSDETVYERPRGRHATQGFNGFYAGDVDAEEIFRNFFFGGMPPATAGFSGFRFGTGPSVRTAEFHVGNSNLRALFQILPILLLLLVNFWPSSEPIYSLNRTYHYEHRVVSQRGVPYFVKNSNFEQEYPHQSNERVALEERVEREYFAVLSQNCRMELQRRQWGLNQQTPHCDLLKQYNVGA